MGKIKSRHRKTKTRCEAFKAEMKEKLEEFNIFVKQCFSTENLEEFKEMVISGTEDEHLIKPLIQKLQTYSLAVLEGTQDYINETISLKILNVIQTKPTSKKTRFIPMLLEEVRRTHKEAIFYMEYMIYLDMLLQWYYGNLKSLGFHAQ